MGALTTILYVLLAIGILLLMVMIHEFGHYIAAKILGFKINEFAIGFGPKLFSKKRKNGEIFSVRAFPLGGFCAFEGEDEVEIPGIGNSHAEAKKLHSAAAASALQSVEGNEKNILIQNASSEAGAPALKQNGTVAEGQGEKTVRQLKRFDEQAPWKRIIVLISGGLFNVLSAVLFSFLFIAIVGHPTTQVASLIEDRNGNYQSDFQKGDIFSAVNGVEVTVMRSFNELTADLKEGDMAVFLVIRDGKEVTVTTQKKLIESYNEETEKWETYIGFGIRSSSSAKRAGFGDALKYCVPFTGKLSWSVLSALGQMVSGRLSIGDITGPVGTISVMAEASKMDWRNIFMLLPLIAANLGIFNLLPIPALDGSKVLFCLIEKIKGKPVNKTLEGYIHVIGMLVLLGGVILIDIIGFFVRGS